MEGPWTVSGRGLTDSDPPRCAALGVSSVLPEVCHSGENTWFQFQLYLPSCATSDTLPDVSGASVLMSLKMEDDSCAHSHGIFEIA